MTFVQTFFDTFKRKTIGLVKKVLFCKKMAFTPQPTLPSPPPFSPRWRNPNEAGLLQLTYISTYKVGLS